MCRSWLGSAALRAAGVAGDARDADEADDAERRGVGSITAGGWAT
jgi:hypothetical protein